MARLGSFLIWADQAAKFSRPDWSFVWPCRRFIVRHRRDRCKVARYLQRVSYNLTTGKETKIAPATGTTVYDSDLRTNLVMNDRYIAWAQVTGYSSQAISQIHLYDRNTSEETVLSTPNSRYDDEPTFSGNLLVYSAALGEGKPGENGIQIFTYNPADQSRQQLTSDPTGKSTPRLSADGHWLFYTEINGQSYNVVTVYLPTGTHYLITRDGISAFFGFAAIGQEQRVFFASKTSSQDFTDDLFYRDVSGFFRRRT